MNVIDNPGIQALLADLGIDLQLPAGVNVAPTESLTLLRAGENGITASAARWWLTPSWAPAVEQKYAMFNARAETLAKSRAYKKPFASQRGIVPVSSFIEWRAEEGVKQPWLISNEARALALAALWDVWHGEGEALLSCTLVTTAAADSFAPWHHRMPVVLCADECQRWLDNSHRIDAEDPLFRPGLKHDWLLRPLDRAVNNARNKSPELMRGLAEPLRLAS
ncbi:MAG: SOS response-associated peptidase [Pseudomonadota bacterium]